MKNRNRAMRLRRSLVGCLFLCLSFVPAAWAQQTGGSVSVIVLDASGGVVPGATLTLTDVATNEARTAVTQEQGNYAFVNLNFGQYKLTVTLQGFQTQTFDVLVQSARTTDVKATLKTGGVAETVEVSGASPIVETSTNAINTTIDVKQIEDLPLAGRNIAQLSQLTAGYNGTWNGLPSFAQSNSVDGTIGNTNRWRYQTLNSAQNTAVTPRLENIAEMVVSSDQIDMNQGFGSSSMTITYITRRGTNNFSGRLYEAYRSEAFDANNWNSSVEKAKYHRNDFGASVGGPIFRDKLFFFGSMAALDIPGGALRTQTFLADDAKKGIFTYANGAKANLFNIFAAANAANGTNYPASAAQINAMTSARIADVDSYRQNAGVLSAPSVQPADPNLRQWEWNRPNSNRTYYPTFRVDSNLSQNWRLNVSYNQTKLNAPNANADHWPGDGRGAGNISNNISTAVGLQTILSPNLINDFKGGYLYTAQSFGINGSEGFYESPTINYNYGNYNDNYELPNSRKQPIMSISNTMTWTKGAHMMKFGGNWYREVNQYWDPPEGYTIIGLSLVEGDPARDVLTKEALQAAAGPGAPVPTDAEWANARALYAMLSGRISGFTGRHAYVPGTGTYASGSTPNRSGVAFSTLDELMKSWGLFVQDQYRMKPNLTVNMGLRWDFVSPDIDRTGKYHSLTPQDVFGPTGVGDLFNPGPQSLTGTLDPVYVAREASYGHWNVTPQPSVGVAWTPRSGGSFVERMLGGDKSVLRASYSFRRFTMPQQFVWDYGSSFANSFYQNFSANSNLSGAAGTFLPGSIALGQAGYLPKSCALSASAPCYVYSPAQYSQVTHMKDYTFQSGNIAVAGMKSDIRMPYASSWTVGIQRDLGARRALEVRYNGNITRNQWLASNINEVNIFENGFLDEFKNAQKNLAINQAAGVTSFANLGRPGQVNLPIFTATGIAFNNAAAVNNLLNGQAGTLANTLATNRDFYCRMVGTTFEPCGPTYGAGAGYPINFWRANPFANGAATYMDDSGYSNYNGLQVEFRQRQWHGMSMNANYTLSKTYGVAAATDFQGIYTQFTLRDPLSSEAPAPTDRRHVVHVSGTYDLPFGNGRKWLQDGVLDKIAGGWTVSTIVTFQSGTPFRITGNNNTFNNLRDGGLVLNGVTQQDIQDRIGLYFDKAGLAYFLPPDWINQVKTDGSLTSNNVPGTWGDIFYLHGPHQTFTDIGISKNVPITGSVRFKFQMEMLNAFNHPTFAQGTTGLASTGFGRANQIATSRRIEFRGNIEF